MLLAKSIPVPRRMSALQRDVRGYPVPFVVMRDADNRPLFTINDHRSRWKCAVENRCAICGTKIRVSTRAARSLNGAEFPNELCWFVGGPLSAFHPYGAYRDTALHHECMTYAMQVCPYLAMPSYNGRIDDRTVDYEKLPMDGITFVDMTIIPERPQLFVAVGSRKQILMTRAEMTAQERVHSNVRPERPYAAVEYWQGGVKLDEAAALPLVARALREYGDEGQREP